MAEQLRLKHRILKLGLLSSKINEWIRKEAKVQPPVDSVILAVIFIFAAYLPMLIVSIVYSLTCKK